MNDIGSNACSRNAIFIQYLYVMNLWTFVFILTDMRLVPCDEQAQYINKYGSFAYERNEGFNGYDYSCENVSESKFVNYHCDVRTACIRLD